MQLKEMYPALVNSVATALTGAIGVSDTTLFVLDDSRIPDPPNLLVIGENSALAETVKRVEKNSNQLTVQRGFQGSARAWNAGTTVSRNFTAYDHDAFKANVETLADGQEAHGTAALPHITGDGAFDYGFRIDGGNLIFMYKERGEHSG
jgi:hypothetical protein